LDAFISLSDLKIVASGHADQGMRWDSAALDPDAETVSLTLISLPNFSMPESLVLSAVDTVVLTLRFWRARRERNGPVGSLILISCRRV
jgi:hypothetical protein